MITRFIRALRALCAVCVLCFLCALCVVHAQLTPIPQGQGGNGLGLALRRLGVPGRVPYVTAPPDHEAKGGGQHPQASPRLAVGAFRAAADPARFPEQLTGGLAPWQARKVYQGGVGGGRDAISGPPPVTMKTSVYDPLLGMSWQQLGSIARAAHRCQGASQLEADPGTGEGVYYLVDSAPPVAGRETDILDGVDLSLRSLRRFVAGDEARVPSLDVDLDALQKRIDQAQ